MRSSRSTATSISRPSARPCRSQGDGKPSPPSLPGDDSSSCHTDPNRSNSGLLTLVLMAYEFAGKERGLSIADVAQKHFLDWLRSFEQAVARPGGSLTNSTGTLMREMVLRGPSQYDCLLVYENLAIDYLLAARDHWGELHVDYPEPNMWNEHPYYILDVPWSKPGRACRRGGISRLSYERTDPATGSRARISTRQSRHLRPVRRQPPAPPRSARTANRFAKNV